MLKLFDVQVVHHVYVYAKDPDDAINLCVFKYEVARDVHNSSLGPVILAENVSSELLGQEVIHKGDNLLTVSKCLVEIEDSNVLDSILNGVL